MIWSELFLVKNQNIQEWLPKLQAHRGFWIHGAAQNSLAAIKQAYQVGYKMCEFDVRMTADGVVVLFHDDRYQNRVIDRTSYQELNTLIATTTLEELFAWVSLIENFALNIEIKSSHIIRFSLEKKVCELIKKYQLERKVIISSFNPMSLFKFRWYCPQIYRALLLTFEKKSDTDFFLRSGILFFISRPHMLNLRYLDYSDYFRFLAKKIPIILWTVNNLTTYHRVKDEIHGVISDTITPQDWFKNYPAGLLKDLEKH